MSATRVLYECYEGVTMGSTGNIGALNERYEGAIQLLYGCYEGVIMGSM